MKNFATVHGLIACFAPACSLNSNGVCEAFGTTPKCDQVRVNPCLDALVVHRQLPAWFDDQKTIHPQSGLRMRSPRELVAEQVSARAEYPV